MILRNVFGFKNFCNRIKESVYNFDCNNWVTLKTKQLRSYLNLLVAISPNS